MIVRPRSRSHPGRWGRHFRRSAGARWPICCVTCWSRSMLSERGRASGGWRARLLRRRRTGRVRPPGHARAWQARSGRHQGHRKAPTPRPAQAASGRTECSGPPASPAQPLRHIAYQGTDRGKARDVTGAMRPADPRSWGTTSHAAGAEGRCPAVSDRSRPVHPFRRHGAIRKGSRSYDQRN